MGSCCVMGACCVMSKVKMLLFFTFWTGTPVLYVDTDQHLTQLLCSLYTGVDRSTSEVWMLHAHTYMYTSVYMYQHYTLFLSKHLFFLLIYTSVAAHSLLQRKQEDREEAERRDQLKQLQSGAKQIVCSVTGDLFIDSIERYQQWHSQRLSICVANLVSDIRTNCKLF